MQGQEKQNKELKWESVENLMLMSVFGQDSFRHSAIQELQRRKLLKNPDQFIDTFMTNLSVVR